MADPTFLESLIRKLEATLKRQEGCIETTKAQLAALKQARLVK